jgi:4-hydroxymandelate oxidase
VRDYYAGGARDEHTLRENRAAWSRHALRHRVLVDVSRRTTATTVLGQPVSMPVLVAPTAFHKLAHPDGELATARAAARVGTAMVLSTLSTTDVEDVAGQGAPTWFQLYVYKDRALTRAVVARAEAAGCRALVLTADASILGTRERDVRNRFHLPDGIQIRNATPPGYASIAAGDGSGLARWVSEALDPAVTWKDVEWLRGITRLPILLKGGVRGDDAARAVDHGAAGLVVSNHGGRQLDGSPATADVLAEVVDAARGLEVLVDGGVRRGTDVLKALALGAKAVLIGRPVLWGLAIDGEAGVARVLEMLRAELDEAMALAGCPTVAEATRDLVRA